MSSQTQNSAPQPPVKIKKKGLVRRFFGSPFQFRRWASVDEIKDNANIVSDGFKRIFYTLGNKNQAMHHETFEEAKTRLKLSDAGLAQKMRQYAISATVFGVVGLLLLTITIRNFAHGLVLSGLVSLVLTALTAVFAYRDHFWYTQIKYRTLGCNFKNWFDFTFKNNKGISK